MNTGDKCPISRPEDLTNVPQLAAYLKYLKPKRFTLKGMRTKQQKLTCYLPYKIKDMMLTYYFIARLVHLGNRAFLYIENF
jgi:hypothetical protein